MLHSSAPTKTPWVARAPVWQIVVVAFLAGFGLWAFNAAFDTLAATGKGLAVRTMQIVDVLLGMFVAVLVLRILLAARERHQRVARNLAIIADMNHHIRNALERICLAAQLSDNEQTVGHIRESSSRIEWALRELLPKSGRE